MSTIRINTESGSDVLVFGFLALVNSPEIDPVWYTETTTGFVSSTGSRVTLLGSFESPIEGTVTRVNFRSDSGGPYADITGLDFDLANFITLLEARDSAGIFALLSPIRFIGNIGADVGTGTADGDDMSGGAGNDVLSGYAGDDTIEGGEGADEMHGGTGKDTLSYKDSASGVTVNLKGTVSGGDAAGDTFDGFENVTGSAFDDKLYGTNNINVLNGGDGDDVLRGLGGADTLTGGDGNDTADYTGSKGAVTVDLATDTASGGHAEGDIFSSIENVTGSKRNDKLTGSIASNALDGAAGNDRLDGGIGNDLLTGGIGRDRFVLTNLAASADDIVDFEVGIDKLEVSAAAFGGGLDALLGLSPDQLELNDSGLATSNAARFIVNLTTGELHYDNNGLKDGGPGNRVVAVVTANLPLLTADDFLIV